MGPAKRSSNKLKGHTSAVVEETQILDQFVGNREKPVSGNPVYQMG